MRRPTAFAARADGPAERVAGFVAHLRLNGFAAGPAETAAAMAALAAVDAADPAAARRALRVTLAVDADTWERFDPLFDAYWYRTAPERSRPAATARDAAQRPAMWRRHLGTDGGSETGGASDTRPDDGPETEAEGVDGRLVATRTEALTRRDLRDLVDPDEIAEAERIAARLARALVDRRSRRQRPSSQGRRPDLRRTLRASLARGGEPLDLARTRRPDRPARIVALCDVSGSMTVYARVFLAFLKGLAGADRTAEAHVFHTRALAVTDALRERDGMRAAARLSLIAQGFGGGTDIGASLSAFADRGAGRLTRRHTVLILSDGYCTGAPERIGTALARIRRRAGRIVWLNPLAGWAGYAPVASGMSAALPHLDALRPANTLAALAALERDLARL